MQIRTRYFLLFLLIALLVGYLIGGFWPFFSIPYQLSDAPIDKGMHASNLINVLLVVCTSATVIVALFKDEIIGNFKRVEITADALCNTVEEYFNDDQGDGDPTVAKFYNQMVIINKGNVNALDCELMVEEMTFKGRNEVHPHRINISKKKIQIGGQERTYIPKNGGRREVDILEIMASEDPSGNKKTQLIIANNPVPVKDGIWIVKCCLNMSNASIKHYQCQIEWDGHWHDHKSNMQIQIQIKKI